jgi:hypothetical protein
MTESRGWKQDPHPGLGASESDAERRRPRRLSGDVLVAVHLEPTCARTRTGQPAGRRRSAGSGSTREKTLALDLSRGQAAEELPQP